MTEPSLVQPTWAIYVKVTERCNLRCPFCYVSKSDRPSLIERISPRELAQVLYEKVFRPLEKRGAGAHLIFHGGEFSLYGSDRIAHLVYELNRRTGCIFQYSAMSNFSSHEMQKNWKKFLSVGVGLSTSFNSAVLSRTWLKVARNVLSAQSILHFNRVFSPSDLDRSIFSVFEKLREFFSEGHIVLKYERYVDPERPRTPISSDGYRRASERLIELFEEILSRPRLHFHFYTLTFPWLLLVESIKRKKKLPMRGFFCSAFCSHSMLVVNSDFSLSLCTKKYRLTRFGNLLEVDDAIRAQEKAFEEQVRGVYDEECSSCRYFGYCYGTCRFVEPFDETGECANSRLVIDWLLSLKRDQLEALSETNRLLQGIKDLGLLS